jgi:hypothetical protein
MIKLDVVEDNWKKSHKDVGLKYKKYYSKGQIFI